MRYHNITTDDMLNGEGLRVVLWVSGCEHACSECHNPVTWNPEEGLMFNQDAKQEIWNQLDLDHIAGITFSGGDPLFPSNREDVTAFAKETKMRYPNKTVWLYTGYQWEHIKELEIMTYIDVLVDGPYKKELRDTKLHWVGSSNQRVIDVAESVKTGRVVLKN